ncbi:vWA domain-containing protein, partial [Aquibaculum arenosum]
MHRTLTWTAGFLFLTVGASHAADDVMIVYDGSNSMWGQIDGAAKIEIAREAMGSLLGEWADGTNVGLMAYGHRREADCGDIETIVQPAPLERDAFMERVQAITPRGKTPLTAAVEEAAQVLAFRDNPATVILITDGVETCQRDPCALADQLETAGVGFTAHVVGFDLSGEDQEAVACLADRTGGRFLAADNADELSSALGEVGETLAQATVEEPEPEPEPEEPALPSVEVTAPETATIGSTVEVEWNAPEQSERDMMTIVPLGTEDGEVGNYIRVRDDSAGTLQVPANTGFYEVRYVVNDGRGTAGSAEIEVVDAAITLEAPENATSGAAFAVSWSDSIHPQDYVTIVPMGAEEGESGAYIRT